MNTTSTKQPIELLILEEGRYYQDRGMVVCAAKTAAAMLRWIRKNYPNHRRNYRDTREEEIFFEDDETRTWLRCGPIDKCPLAT